MMESFIIHELEPRPRTAPASPELRAANHPLRPETVRLQAYAPAARLQPNALGCEKLSQCPCVVSGAGWGQRLSDQPLKGSLPPSALTCALALSPTSYSQPLLPSPAPCPSPDKVLEPGTDLRSARPMVGAQQTLDSIPVT